MPPAFGREAQGWHVTRKAQETQGIFQRCSWHGQTGQSLSGFVCLALGKHLEKTRVAHLVRHVAFLLSLLHLLHYKGALNVSKYLISSVSEWVCCADDGWLGVGWVLEMPTAVPHPFPLTAFVLSSFPVVPP